MKDVFTTALPLIGVLIGWALKEISDTLRSGHKQSLFLNKATGALLLLRADVLHARLVTKEMTSFKEPALGIRARQTVLAANAAANARAEETFNSVLDQIAEIDPLLYLALSRAKRSVVELRELDFKSFREVPTMLANIVEVAHLTYQTTLRDIDSGLLRISRRHSVSLWWRVRREMKKQDKPRSGWSSAVEIGVEGCLEEFAALRKHESETKTPQKDEPSE